jgi:hypothetical protein
MTKSKSKDNSQKLSRHIFCVAAEDVEAAQRVLAVLTQTEERGDERSRGTDGRSELLARARFALV